MAALFTQILIYRKTIVQPSYSDLISKLEQTYLSVCGQPTFAFSLLFRPEPLKFNLDETDYARLPQLPP